MLDRNKMHNAGYSNDIIDYYQQLFDFSDYGITCLSVNSIDYLSMWVYYTNNHKGFCVEYEAIKKDCIHEVLYEPERIKVASLIFQCRDAIKKAITLGQREQAEFYSTLLFTNKAESWEQEKEYRIVYPLDNSIGMNVSVGDLGLRTSRIIAGINCSENNIIKLNDISNELGLGSVYKSRIHSEKYTLDYIRWR